ncbi:M23 family metallopeptidase [Candidatus Daviesbacteria bacterium]|nr:M23 family metallopeptidase [Candidatus Daviesbacteria bacterium]
MKKQFKNSLPKAVFERVALNQKLPKIGPRFQGWFKRLSIIFLVAFALLGYYPSLSMPPVRLSTAKAQGLAQRGEILASSFSQALVLPHPGYLSTRFSNYHPAVDIASGLGMPIRPILKGVVEKTGKDFFGLGNYVVVTHEKGFQSTYGHMGKIFVREDQAVSSENILGEVGLTGHTSGPHTHLEIRQNGKYIDPLPLLPQIPDMPRIAATK